MVLTRNPQKLNHVILQDLRSYLLRNQQQVKHLKTLFKDLFVILMSLQESDGNPQDSVFKNQIELVLTHLLQKLHGEFNQTLSEVQLRWLCFLSEQFKLLIELPNNAWVDDLNDMLHGTQHFVNEVEARWQ